MPADNDDDQHRQEQQDLRAKRKAAKISKTAEQVERDRKRAEYRQKILEKHGHAHKKAKTGGAAPSGGPATPTTQSAFEALFTQRAQGFQIDFRFRNALPRPPVGPCFMGDTLHEVLLHQCRQYKPLNAVEANYVWKLHCEADLGVPLAPSAMDINSYVIKADTDETNALHPDDEALLNWTGSLGDTAADNRQKRQEQAMRKAQQWLQSSPTPNASASGAAAARKLKDKKAFSRVLHEDLQTWMKKTTYLSNNYNRRVHDFKSLAQTKQELAADLQTKQTEMAQRRSLQAIENSFRLLDSSVQHPTKKHLKPKKIYPVLPHTAQWGRAFTHVVIDKPPTNLTHGIQLKDLNTGAFIANVAKGGPNERMSCQLMAPKTQQDTGKPMIVPVQALDLDVIPLKDEDSPHVNFCFWITDEEAFYTPIASRIQLSMGRPVVKPKAQLVSRRPLTESELRKMEERMAEVDEDMAKKHNVSISNVHEERARPTATTTTTTSTSMRKHKTIDDDDDDDDDDGEGDYGDDDDDDDSQSEGDEQIFGGATKTIVADS